VHGTLGRQRRLLLTTDAVGGVWRYSLAITAGLTASGWHCTLATLGPSPGDHQRAEAAAIPGCTLVDTGLPLEWTARDAAALTAAAHALGRLARDTGAETAHLHTPALAAFDWPVPVVAVAHSCVGTWWQAVHGTEVPDDFRWRMGLMAEGLRRAGAVIAPSQAMADALEAVYGADRRIDIVHNGLPSVRVAPAVRERRVLAAGRLWDAGKNMAVLDAAAGLVGAPVHAAGPLRGPGDAHFAPRHLNAVGNLSPAALRDAMATASVFAAPSVYEPFGLAVLEAAQVATPLVLADNATFRELWTGAAIFVDSHDTEAWASALRAVLDSPDDCAALGVRAQLRARCYCATKMVRQTADIHTAAALEKC
jgi:glycosyltransferase involved in cell wall biosynthesis